MESTQVDLVIQILETTFQWLSSRIHIKAFSPLTHRNFSVLMLDRNT